MPPTNFKSVNVTDPIFDEIAEIARIEGRKKYAVVGRAIALYREHSELQAYKESQWSVGEST